MHSNWGWRIAVEPVPHVVWEIWIVGYITAPAFQQKSCRPVLVPAAALLFRYPDRDVAHVAQGCEGRVNAAQSRLTHLETQVHVGMRDRGVERVEAPDLHEIIAPHRQACRRKRGD